MAYVDRPLSARGGIVAGVGILLLALSQASVSDGSQDRPRQPDLRPQILAKPHFDAANMTAKRRLLSSRDSGGLARAFPSPEARTQRPGVVAAKFTGAG